MSSGRRRGDDPLADLMLGPATRLLWRTRESVHLELGSRAVIVDGLPPEVTARLATRGADTHGDTVESGVPVGSGTEEAVRTLAESGYLWARPEPEEFPFDDGRFTPPAPRLAGELAGLAARHGERAAELLNARRHATVAVSGEDRLAVQLAALLAAAGVGRIDCPQRGSARLLHAAPGGVSPAEEGLDLAQAAQRAVRRAAPETVLAPAPLGQAPDLTVLVSRGPVDDGVRDLLHLQGAAHLAVTIGADHGSVGPLVLPGLTSCLRCADLHRSDRDPAWPALAVQLAVPPRSAPPSDIAVTTLVSAVAAVQALAFLDGTDAACVEATLEVRLPDWRLRRRRWPVHPECECCPF